MQSELCGVLVDDVPDHSISHKVAPSLASSDKHIEKASRYLYRCSCRQVAGRSKRLQLRIGKDLVEGGLQRCQSVRNPRSLE